MHMSLTYSAEMNTHRVKYKIISTKTASSNKSYFYDHKVKKKKL